MIGKTVSHYRILEKLGGGGMGVVYRAEDLTLKRTVALKFLPREWSSDPDSRKRFMREAQAASAPDHPQICTIHEIDETDDGQLFIVMAFYEGETLKKKIERGPLSIREAVDIAIQTAQGLDKAHEHGITHRDIKPANVLLTADRDVKIVDFGLAKLMCELSLTQIGAIIGTPFYMSPEQSRGNSVDHRSDIWSLGVLMYEMVTGTRPFVGDNADAVVHAIRQDRPRPLGELAPDAPPMLGRIIGRALEKEPGGRYPTAAALLEDLRGLQSAQLEASEETIRDVFTAPRRRSRLATGAGVAAALIAVAVATLLWHGRRQPSPEPIEKGPKRIVVLPFKNLGPPEQGYFAYGMTEAITSRLVAISGLEVISRTTADRYRDTDKSCRQIGEELDVAYLLR
jgi:serine/threonine protein kinase